MSPSTHQSGSSMAKGKPGGALDRGPQAARLLPRLAIFLVDVGVENEAAARRKDHAIVAQGGGADGHRKIEVAAAADPAYGTGLDAARVRREPSEKFQGAHLWRAGDRDVRERAPERLT